MDPDATLEELRLHCELEKARGLTTGEAERMAVLVEALDQWLSSGGFLPAAWQR